MIEVFRLTLISCFCLYFQVVTDDLEVIKKVQLSRMYCCMVSKSIVIVFPLFWMTDKMGNVNVRAKKRGQELCYV